MASIFTYDPDPPRVSSPWPASVRTAGAVQPRAAAEGHGAASQSIEYPMVTRLEAEPQDGPTEYKLHLLLRPRRSFTSTSTRRHAPSSSAPRDDSIPTPSGGDGTPSRTPPPPPLSSTSQSRQHRLEQLTTQLLWRLQQSSPYHASSATNLVLPSLPEATPELEPPKQPAKLLQGLEESNGALYEIGVSDDGMLVGLAEDEMDESINNLRAMAGSLGCSVEVLRMVEVGECEWIEDVTGADGVDQVIKSSKLYVAEAFVKPELRPADERLSRTVDAMPPQTGIAPKNGQLLQRLEAPEQLRVTLTGATTSGKSSLLGTLSTSTLDNGRGKSRLSLLKHRHEIVSGVTSSVTQEILGYVGPSNMHAANGTQSHSLEPHLASDPDFSQYRFIASADTDSSLANYKCVINYASDNISSWSDVHVAAQSGRLVMISDSAGHPRYRRTTVRGLVGWAPHWTMLCIAANDDLASHSRSQDTDSEVDSSAFSGANAHLSMAHLELCLRLNLRLVVVLTKLDAATKHSLRQILSTILSVLKNAGRVPLMLHNDSRPVSEAELQTISAADLDEVRRVLGLFDKDATNFVPILLTSALRGTGIGKLHGLLRLLPIPDPRQSEPLAAAIESPIHVTSNSPEFSDSEPAPSAVSPDVASTNDHPAVLFHVEDVYHLPSKSSTSSSASLSKSSTILSGIVSRGTIHLGGCLLLGPFSSPIQPTTTTTATAIDASPCPSPSPQPTSSSTPPLPPPHQQFLTPRSFATAFAHATAAAHARILHRPHTREWRPVAIVSARNMRLPVPSLHSGQVGTLAVVAVPGSSSAATDVVVDNDQDDVLHVRKGMVLLSVSTTTDAATTAAPAAATTTAVAGPPPPPPPQQDQHQTPKAAHTLTALFSAAEARAVVVGSRVVVYCASVRASAKVVAAELVVRRPPAMVTGAGGGGAGSGAGAEREAEVEEEQEEEEEGGDEEEDGFGVGFAFDDLDGAQVMKPQQQHEADQHDDEEDNDDDEEDDQDDEDDSVHAHDSIAVSFQFVTYREWIEVGAQVLVMPGGGPGLLQGGGGGGGGLGGSIAGGAGTRGVKGIGGLDGFVGTVVRTFG